MKLKTVTKRSGSTVEYDRGKIFTAIVGANRDATKPEYRLSPQDVEIVTNAVEFAIADHDSIGVEEIQDQVEKSLMENNFFDVAKQYIVYREKHAQRRRAQKKLMDTYRDIFFAAAETVDSKRDNANINTDASMGIMLKLGAEGAKHFVDNYVLPKEFAEADRENFIHIHDKDFSLITLNCCQIDLLKLFHGGFSTGHGYLREPQSIRSYASLACIAIQSNQNDMFGGQSINAFDYAMAEGVRKSFKKILKAEISRACEFCDVTPQGEIDFNICTYTETENPAAVENLTAVVGSKKLAEKIYKQACRDVEEETHQAMEALIHNFNTLHSRAGAQVPFSSINYGMDTSPEGRLATREVLNAIEAGLGNGETPIFPISVFQLKAGVNYYVDDPNYDLFRQACKVSAKRLFPNFVNLDAPYNLQYYKPDDYNSYVATMGCADGDEIVFYRHNGKFFCESLRCLWNRNKDEIFQQGLSKYKIPEDIEVWDGENGFVSVKKIIKNPDQGNWTRVKFTNGRSILVTEDHPLYTENRGRIHVKDLKVGDTIQNYCEIPILSECDSVIDVNLAYLLGMMFRSARFSGSIVRVVFTGKLKDTLAKKFANIAKDALGFDFGIRNSAINAVEVFTRQIEANNYFRMFFDIIREGNRNISSKIFTASREVRLAFLAGIIDTDSDRNIDPRSNCTVHAMRNKEVALQIVALVESLGYYAEILLNHRDTGYKEEITYRVKFLIDDEIKPYLETTCSENLMPKNVFHSMRRFPKIVKVTSIEYLGNLNKDSYDIETESDRFTLSFINSGNCRTRVMSNVNGAEQSGSRGNFSFVTINLPKLALEAKGNIDKFFELYDKYISISHDYLLFRLKTIEEKHVYNYPFLMGQGVWLGSDKLKPTDSIKEVLKHASYSIGFCGLAECLVALIGKHHGQSAEAQELGLKIVGHLRERTDAYTKAEKRNWTTFGTPAESTAGQFQRANRKQYGLIKGVTSRDYMTNSSHVPVYFPICAHDKIQIEAPYHALCNAGHIAYVEMDGDPTKNISAFEAVVRAMHDANMGYFSINHPVDRDPVCGYTGIISNECPHCHRKEVERGTFHIDRLK